jgi:hypothetical protein
MPQVDCYLYRQEPLEESIELFSLGLNLRPNALTQATVPRGNAYLHVAGSLH